MHKVLSKDYPLYEASYGSDFPSEQYFLISFDELASRFEFSAKTYDKSIEEYFISKGFIKESDLKISNRRMEVTHAVKIQH